MNNLQVKLNSSTGKYIEYPIRKSIWEATRIDDLSQEFLILGPDLTVEFDVTTIWESVRSAVRE